VGRLKDGKTRGVQLLVFAVPYRGRAIPFFFISYSSRTIAEEESSRNLEHRRGLEVVKLLIGDKPVVLDREFSYQGLFEDFVEEGMKFVIRLNTGNHPTFKDKEGNKVVLSLAPRGTGLPPRALQGGGPGQRGSSPTWSRRKDWGSIRNG